MKMPHDLYICYSNRDAAVADAVCAALEASGLKCWIAPRDVLPGMNWADAVLDAIAQSRLAVLIFSSRANESPHVKRDVERVAGIGIPLIPFRIEDVPPSDTFAYFLESCHWLNAVTPPLDSHLQELVEAAHRILFSKRPKLPDDQTSSFTKTDNYDVFISYRRERGAAEARVIRSELRERKLRAFLDVDDLRAGHFDAALLRRIEETPNFILVLSPNSLDRCTDKKDWLRQEIAHALKTERNIIPIMLPGFKFPDRDALPPDLRDLPTHNGLEWSHKYFAAMIADIVMYLRPENSRPIVANAESAARGSAATPEFSPMHTPSAEDMHSCESNEHQMPAPSALASPIETASPGKAATSEVDDPISSERLAAQTDRTIRGTRALLRRVKTRAGVIVLAVLVFIGFAFYGLTKLKSGDLETNSNQAQSKKTEPSPGASGPSPVEPAQQADQSKKTESSPSKSDQRPAESGQQASQSNQFEPAASVAGTIWRFEPYGTKVAFKPNGAVQSKDPMQRSFVTDGRWEQNGNYVKFVIKHTDKYQREDTTYEAVISPDGNEMKGRSDPAYSMGSIRWTRVH